MATTENTDRYLSQSIENLIGGATTNCDILIIGSGYGGSIAAAELVKHRSSPPAAGTSDKVGDVFVFERGREYLTGEFPESIDEAPGHIQYWRDDEKQPLGKPDGLFDFRVERDCAILTGCGLGGGSLINAGVVYEPPDETFGKKSEWPSELQENGNGIPLKGYLKKVSRLLGAAPFRDAKLLPKYQALERIGKALGATVEPAKIAVRAPRKNEQSKENEMAVEQHGCVQCGNCITGCNFGAKNTLTMNFLPFAVSRGVKCYSGATVLRIQRNTGRIPIGRNGKRKIWRVFYIRTAASKSKALPQVHTIDACQVLLCAGTLGSVEILCASAESGLQMSTALGKRVSGNGGFLGFGFGQLHKVNAVAGLVPGPRKKTQLFSKIGPTILGNLTYKDEKNPRCSFSLQDGAIPFSLAPFMNTMGTTLAMPHLYFRDKLPEFLSDQAGLGKAQPGDPKYKRRDPDPIGLHEDALQHMQVLLGTTEDMGTGEMILRPVEDSIRKRIRVTLPFADEKYGATHIHKTLCEIDKQGKGFAINGFDGGYYLPNPLWKLLPDEAKEVAGKIKSRRITVHPLGGCVMGNDVRCGVVNHLGEVFDPTAKNGVKTYDGLRVLDGSIIPAPLGINPMLTIGALAMRSAEQLANAVTSTEMPDFDVAEVYSALSSHRTPGKTAPLTRNTPKDAKLSFTEVLYSLPARRYDARDGTEDTRIIASDQIQAFEELIGDALAYHQDSSNIPLSDILAFDVYKHITRDSQVEDRSNRKPAKPQITKTQINEAAKLLAGYIQPDYPGTGVALRLNPDAPLNDWLADPRAIWTGQSQLALWDFGAGARENHQHTGFWAGTNTDPNAAIEFFGATLLALTKPGELSVQILALDEPTLPGEYSERLEAALEAYCVRRGISLDDLKKWRESKEYNRASSLHSGWRILSYELKMPAFSGEIIRASGQKLLAYDITKEQLWSALTNIDIHFESDRKTPRDAYLSLTLPMAVDVPELFRNNLLQLENAQSTPHVVAHLIDIAGVWLRALIGSHYWTFEGIDYGQCSQEKNVRDLLSTPFKRTDSEVGLNTKAPLDVTASLFLFEVKRTTKQRGQEYSPQFDGVGCTRSNQDKFLPERESPPDNLLIRLTRFHRPEAGRDAEIERPLLLIHGLSHGGEIFTTHTVEENLVEHLLATRRTVWVLDYRISNLRPDANAQPGDLDDLARHDIPAALELIQAVDCNGDYARPVHLDCIAHCIGAAAFSMAVLGGHLKNKGNTRRCLAATSNLPPSSPSMPAMLRRISNKPVMPTIESVVLHAFHPFVVPSRWNRNSAAIAAFTQNILGEDVINPIPPDQSGLADQIIDRIGSSVEWTHKLDDTHHDDWSARSPKSELGHRICNRLTFYYGREWVHDNVNHQTISDLPGLIGPAHLDFMKHAFHMVRRERLTTAEADDDYLSEHNIKKHWTFNTLFATGAENEVFDPRSVAKTIQIFSRINSPTSVRQNKYSAYIPSKIGHMDFIFGKNNGRSNGVFAHCSQFLDDPAQYENFSKAAKTFLDEGELSILAPDTYREKTPLAGPIISYDLNFDDPRLTPERPDQFSITPIRVNSDWITARAWFELRPYGRDKVETRVAVEARAEDHLSSAGKILRADNSELVSQSQASEFLLRGSSGSPISRQGRYLEILFAANDLEKKFEIPIDRDISRNAKEVIGAFLEKANLEDLVGNGIDPQSDFIEQRSYAENKSSNRFAGLANFVVAISKLQGETFGEFLETLPNIFGISASEKTDEDLLYKLLQSPLSQLQQYSYLNAEDRSGNAVKLKVSLNEQWAQRLPVILEKRATGKTTAEQNVKVDCIRILLGSCRWPGLFAESSEVETVFEAMNQIADEGVDGLWLLGDNIYADATANLFESRETEEKAADRYRHALTADARYDQVYHSKAMRSLVAKVPTWMVVDDHEIEDDWPGMPPKTRLPSESESWVGKDGSVQKRFSAAIAYQWRRPHSRLRGGAREPGPSLPLPSAKASPAQKTRGFWRKIQTAGLACFALDTRTEREVCDDADWRHRSIMAPDQCKDLHTWLSDESNRRPQEPMFILCGSPFGLVRRPEYADPAAASKLDDWTGYPESMKFIMKEVVDHKIRSLYFVSGDPHISCRVTVNICVDGNPDKQYQITSLICSGLNASLPFANAKPRDFVTKAEIPNTRCQNNRGESITATSTFELLCDAPRHFGMLEIVPHKWQDTDKASVNLSTYVPSRNSNGDISIAKRIWRTQS